MSVFLFKFTASGDRVSIRNIDFSRYLPREPRSQEYVSFGSAELRVFSYNAALDKPALETGSGFVFSQGYLPTHRYRDLADRLLDEQPITLIDYPESFCAVSYLNGRVGFISAGTGADQLFIYQDQNSILVTNRHNLLGPFIKEKSLRKRSFWWMAGRSHIGDAGTYWDSIERTHPSTKYIYDGNLQRIATRYDALFDPISIDDIPQTISLIVEHFEDVLRDTKAPKRLSLTGGKDSRAILGLLSAAGQTDNLLVNTSGYYFSPDVISAKNLTDCLGIADQHRITRPTTNLPNAALSDRIADDLLFDFAGRSLADIGKFSFAGDLVLGGHEAGIKSRLNDKDLDTFVRSRRYWVDDRKVLQADVRSELNRDYQASLRETLSDIPYPYYDKVEGLEYRLPHRNSANITGSHVGGSQFHPFYDGMIVHLICGIPPNLLEQQFIPYVFAALATGDLVSPRFADDHWPSSLAQTLDAKGLIEHNRRPLRRNSYRFRDYFPSEKKFGMSGDRLELCNISSTRLVDYLLDNQSFFDFLDFDTVIPLVQKPSSGKTFREMYVHLGLLKSAIVHSTSDRLFDFDSKTSIRHSVEDFLDADRTDDSSKSITSLSVESAETRLLQYEEAIATMERVIVDAEESPDDLAGPVNPDVMERRTENMDASKQYQFDDVLAAATGGYEVLSPTGVVLTTVAPGSSISIKGRLLGLNLTNRSALLFVPNGSSPPYSRMVFSDRLGGYFRYLDPDPSTGCFSEALTATESIVSADAVQIHLCPWKPDGKLLVDTTPTITVHS